jgi:magnesium transporter
MLGKLLIPEIRELIATRDEATLAAALDRWLPADVVVLITELPPDEKLEAFRMLRGPQRVQVFEYLNRPTQKSLLEALSAEDVGHILNEMAPDDRTAIFAEWPPDVAERFLKLLSDDQQAIARSLLEYPENSVGRLMTPDYLAVRQHWTIQHVLDFVRNHGKDSETLNVVYVVDAEHKLIDDLRMRQILLAPVARSVHDLMNRNFVALNAADDQKSAVDVFRRYDRTALPVVDADGVLRGIVTIDDVLDLAEEQATEDLQRFGGLEALDAPYSQTPLMTMVRKRASWLVLLFLGELLTATAMGYFEREIEKAVVLALFVPLIISSGGNSGSQAATLMVRALALGDVRLRDWWKVMRRELFSGFVLGGILGTIGFLRIAVWSGFSDIYGPHWALVGITVGLSLVGIVLWGTLSGAMLPFILKRLKLDPATSSAPFVATLVDVTGLVIYFSVAMVVLGGTLLREGG